MTDPIHRRVRVVDTTGAAVAGAIVAIEASTVPVPEIALVTDDDGIARLSLPPGKFRIGARTKDGRQASVTTGGEGVEPGAEILITLE